jgi:transposase
MASAGDDPGAERSASLACRRPHRYAQRIDGLALLVQETLRRDPHGGHLFVFRGRRGGLIKVLWHDGQGMCLFSKRLERGRFLWPSPADGVVTITPAQLGYLLEGIDWRMPQHTWRPQAAG